MIEEVSYPSNLTRWDPEKEPFYLELFGETSPAVDTTYAEVLPAGSPDGAPQTTRAAPIYEYWWTIGHGGLPHHQRHLPHIFGGQEQAHELWENLQETAASVYLYFPIDGGWRIQELAATVKYLTPFHEQVTLWTRLTGGFKDAEPLLGGAGSLLGLVPNPAFAGASALLSTIAKMQINTVPPSEGFNWSVRKVTFGSGQGVMQGVMWSLPRQMFVELGGRLTGSIAVSFTPSRVQQDDTAFGGDPVYQPKSILAHAVVYGANDRQVWAPAEPRRFIKLQIAPRAPTQG